MRFTLATILAILPIFGVALPPPAHPRVGIKIPITKRSNLVKRDGLADADQLRKHVAYVQGKIQRGSAAFERNTNRTLSFGPGPASIHLTTSEVATASSYVPATSSKPPASVSSQSAPSATIGTPIATSSASSSVNASPSSGIPVSDPITDDSGRLWQGTISVGTPPVTFTVQFDTGSSDLFLPGPDCTENCDGHTIYDPSASSTSSDVGKGFSIIFEDDSAAIGELWVDTVSISNFTAGNQTLGAASQYSIGLSKADFPPDGLLGMAFQSISEYNAPPLLQTLISNGAVDDPVFAFKLAASDSELSIGGVNQDLFTGEFAYAPVIQEGFWLVNMDGVSVNGSEALGTTLSVIDTGTTLVIGDPSSVAQVYKAIPGSKDASNTIGEGFFTVPCNAIPTVSLSFGGKSFDISPELFNLGTIDESGSDCVGGITGMNAGESFWTIGDVFLQNVYTSFDLGHNQVGFATLA